MIKLKLIYLQKIYIFFFRNHAVTPEQMILITLRFLALGGMLICVGDFIGIHNSYSCTTFSNNTEGLKKLHQGFYEIARFSMVGALDYTHMKI